MTDERERIKAALKAADYRLHLLGVAEYDPDRMGLVKALDALTASPATTQGSEADGFVDAFHAHYVEGDTAKAKAILQALATPKPVEAETCAVCGFPVGHQSHDGLNWLHVKAHPFQPKPTPSATATEWRDISSAPKDGTRFLALFDGGHQSVGQYVYGKHFSADHLPHRGNTEPQGWQPLPAPQHQRRMDDE